MFQQLCNRETCQERRRRTSLRLVKQTCQTENGNNCRFVFVIYQSTNSSSLSIARNTLSREASEDQDDPLEYAGGEFDEDERVELVRAARDVKKSGISVRGKVSKQDSSSQTICPIASSIDDHSKDCRTSSRSILRCQSRWPSREEGEVHTFLSSLSSWASKYFLHPRVEKIFQTHTHTLGCNTQRPVWNKFSHGGHHNGGVEDRFSLHCK